jgi:DNA-directed RNA polymerase alpha subunit
MKNVEITLSSPIEELCMMARTYNALVKDGYKTIGDVVKCDRSDILAVPNIGEGSLKDLEEALAIEGFTLLETKPNLKELLSEGPKAVSPEEITLETPIPSIYFSIRPHNALMQDNFKTIGDIVQCSFKELLRVPNFGPKCLEEVEALLASAGLALRDPNTEKPVPPPPPPPPPKPKVIERWIYISEGYPEPGQPVLFYCGNGSSYCGTYFKVLGWCVPHPKSTGPDWYSLTRITVGVVRWMPVPGPDYEREFA